MLGIAAEKDKTFDRRIGGQPRQQLRNGRVARRRLKVKDKAEFEIGAENGTRLELRKIDAGGGEAHQHVRQRARTVRQTHRQRHLGGVGIDLAFARDEDEARVVAAHVRHVVREDLESVKAAIAGMKEKGIYPDMLWE